MNFNKKDWFFVFLAVVSGGLGILEGITTLLGSTLVIIGSMGLVAIILISMNSSWRNKGHVFGLSYPFEGKNKLVVGLIISITVFTGIASFLLINKITEQQEDSRLTPTPLLDIELARVKPSPPFEHLKPDFAYDMILHNKSDVPIHNIVIRMDVLANKNRQKLAVTGTSARNLKPFAPGINVLGAGESKVFHREHSPSYGYMKLTVTYWNNKVWYRCDFEGDRNGINLKGCEPINKKLSIPYRDRDTHH